MTRPHDSVADLLAERRAPTPAEVEDMAEAGRRRGSRPKRVRPPPPPKSIMTEDRRLLTASPHTDDDGWLAQATESLGVDCPEVATLLREGIGQALPATQRPSAADAMASTDQYEQTLQRGLSFVSALEPRSALEAALAVQMLGAHNAAMAMCEQTTIRAGQSGQVEYARLMNQAMRTFTAQVEALQKLRTGGKQQVEVRYVYVDARSQTVVQPVREGLQRGCGDERIEQPHAPGGALGRAALAGLSLWSEDALGGAVPGPGDQGAETMPDAWRPEPRRTHGIGERELSGRGVDTKDDSGQGDGASLRPLREEAA